MPAPDVKTGGIILSVMENPMAPTERWLSPVALFCAAFCLRMIYILWWNPGLTFNDEHRFWGEVEALVTNGFWDVRSYNSHDMPLTAFVLALVVKGTGTGLLGAKVFLAATSALTACLVANLARRLSPTRTTWWLGGTVAALYPFFVFYSALILSETLFLLLVTGFFLRVTRSQGDRLAGGGVLAGLAHLTRPTLLPFLPVCWAYQALVLRQGWRRVALSAVVFTILVSPWVARNFVVHGEFLPGTTESGHVLWEGNNPWNKDGGIERPDWEYLDHMPRGMNPPERDRWQRDRALAYIAAEPGRFLAQSVKKFMRFWHLWPNAPEYGGGLYKWASILSFGPVLLFALLSLWVLRDRWRITLILWGFVSYYTLLHMILFGSIRYRLPLEPLLVAMAAACVGRMITSGPRNGP